SADVNIVGLLSSTRAYPAVHDRGDSEATLGSRALVTARCTQLTDLAGPCVLRCPHSRPRRKLRQLIHRQEPFMSRSTTDVGMRDRYSCDVDLFSEASLNDPYPDYTALRDTGPIAYMPRYDMWAVTRYDEVKRVLRDPDTFSSAHGIGMNTTLNDAWAGMAPTLDGQDHQPLRRVMVQTIGPKAGMKYREAIERSVRDIVEDV